MLALTRKTGERVRIRVGDADVWVVVCGGSVSGGYLRLAFDAPREVEIAREELLPEGERWGAAK
jgi:carbon storage regulator CsrA